MKPQVKPQWNHKWNHSETTVKPQWNHSETTVKPQRNHKWKQLSQFNDSHNSGELSHRTATREFAKQQQRHQHYNTLILFINCKPSITNWNVDNLCKSMTIHNAYTLCFKINVTLFTFVLILSHFFANFWQIHTRWNMQHITYLQSTTPGFICSNYLTKLWKTNKSVCQCITLATLWHFWSTQHCSSLL